MIKRGAKADKIPAVAENATHMRAGLQSDRGLAIVLIIEQPRAPHNHSRLHRNKKTSSREHLRESTKKEKKLPPCHFEFFDTDRIKFVCDDQQITGCFSILSSHVSMYSNLSDAPAQTNLDAQHDVQCVAQQSCASSHPK